METGTNIQCTQVINQTDEARRPQDEFSPSDPHLNTLVHD